MNKYMRNSKESRVFEFLKNSNEPKTAAEIAKACNLSHSLAAVNILKYNIDGVKCIGERGYRKYYLENIEENYIPQ